MCGANIYFEDEFTLVARAQITAWGTVHERPRGQRQSGGISRRIVVVRLCRRRCAEYLDALRRQVLTLAQTAATGSLRAWAAQAEGEVERSEGEGEAQGRPLLDWAICRRLGMRAAGRPGVLWVTWRRVLSARWYGGAGACEGRAVEALAGVTRRLAGFGVWWFCHGRPGVLLVLQSHGG